METDTHIEGGVVLHSIKIDWPQDNYYRWKQDHLSAYDAESLAERGIVEAWYWYQAGGYEGSGELIGRSKGGEQWFLFDLGHCSCYGPCESAPSQFSTLSELEAFPYAERYKRIADLVKVIREAQEASDRG